MARLCLYYYHFTNEYYLLNLNCLIWPFGFLVFCNRNDEHAFLHPGLNVVQVEVAAKLERTLKRLDRVFLHEEIWFIYFRLSGARDIKHTVCHRYVDVVRIVSQGVYVHLDVIIVLDDVDRDVVFGSAVSPTAPCHF